MSISESEVRPSPRFVFEETELFFQGGHNTPKGLKSGIVIGGSVGIRYMGREGRKFKIGLWELKDNQPVGQESAVHMKFSKGYRLLHPTSKIEVLIRAHRIFQRSGTSFLTFDIVSQSRVVKAQTLGITFP